MKRKRQKPRLTGSFSFTVPVEFKAVIDQCAARAGRTRSGFLTWLIRRAQEKDEKPSKI